MTAEHLRPQVTDRGFTHLPPIPVWSGYESPTGSLEELQTHEVGSIRVYESSDAMFPSIWLGLAVKDAKIDEAVMLTVQNARKLGEQLVHLADSHYSGAGHA